MTTITHSGGVIAPTLVDGYQAAREGRTILHWVIGRPDPDVSFRPPALRSGELRCVFATEEAAWAALNVLVLPRMFTLVDPDVTSVGMTFVTGFEDGQPLSPHLDDATRSVWVLVVPFQEVTP